MNNEEKQYAEEQQSENHAAAAEGVHEEWPEDNLRIMKAILAVRPKFEQLDANELKGIAIELWEGYSYSKHAGWLELPKEDEDLNKLVAEELQKGVEEVVDSFRIVKSEGVEVSDEQVGNFLNDMLKKESLLSPATRARLQHAIETDTVQQSDVDAFIREFLPRIHKQLDGTSRARARAKRKALNKHKKRGR